MLSITNTIERTLSQSRLNLIEKTTTMSGMHKDNDDPFCYYSGSERCDYIFIDTDNYARIMSPLASDENVQIMCSEEYLNVFTIMVPVWKMELSQSMIDHIFAVAKNIDISKKVNINPPIPYYIWVNDMVMYASVDMNTNPCATNLNKILSGIEMTDRCATELRKYFNKLLGIW